MTVGKHFWYSLLNISEALAGVDPADQDADRNVLQLLRTLQRAYGKHITPQNHFECYSVMVLCSTVCHVLEKRMEDVDDVGNTTSRY